MSAINVELSSFAGLVTNYLSSPSFNYKNVILPYTPSTLSRVVYFKEASESPGPSVFSIQPSTGTTIQNSTLVYLNNNEAITLQCVSTGFWSILGSYNGISTFSTQVLPSPSSRTVTISSLKSYIFVDLQTESKTLVLPKISELISVSSFCPFLTIKDIYGYANTNPLYISSSSNDTFERSSIQNAICITENYASIELAGNGFLSKWHILNYYNGGLG
jgi:hypothetical protein